jgi:hypothetical protein
LRESFAWRPPHFNACVEFFEPMLHWVFAKPVRSAYKELLATKDAS